MVGAKDTVSCGLGAVPGAVLGEIRVGIYPVRYCPVPVLAMLADRNYLPFIEGIAWFLILIAAVTLASAAIVLVVKTVLGPYSRRVIGA